MVRKVGSLLTCSDTKSTQTGLALSATSLILAWWSFTTLKTSPIQRPFKTCSISLNAPLTLSRVEQLLRSPLLLILSFFILSYSSPIRSPVTLRPKRSKVFSGSSRTFRFAGMQWLSSSCSSVMSGHSLSLRMWFSYNRRSPKRANLKTSSESSVKSISQHIRPAFETLSRPVKTITVL